ncbi:MULTISPECIES: class A sortase [unclassified Bacillus (in: firmicutes)]|uniref:class A sortase n=1 Tax=unclassified Bacillus (in: firmicutes) TaxID=185979 RepID=UPI0022823A41|nr:class A sortase [Bacillus sp. S20C3]MCY8204520.1 class A sortase [Bacillus sp. N12A5]MCY8288439.1 class A sortase [Bacillus sp. N13C7]MCY8639538.1 class A sortase [Bacillus sp. S17B2]MCY8719344.1 class A sortase [Bacillus sp. S10C12M]MCY9142552.1 class A sortase [Bacillus sp. T9C1]
MYKKMIMTVFILFGLLLISSPYIKGGIIAYLSKSQTESALTVEQLKENNEKEAVFEFDSIQPPDLMEAIKAGFDHDQKTIIGRITIKSIGLELPILKGTTNDNLLIGAATMRPDQKMGEGNYPLAGHHLKQKSLLFGPLENIKTGAQIVITDFKKDYIFSVTSKDIISEMDAEVIEETNKKEITLITCDKAVKTEGRLVVKGKLVDSFGHTN